MDRFALTDEAWAHVRDLLPRPAPTGRPPRDPRAVLQAVFWVLSTGAPWRDLPREFGPWQTIYGRFRAWVACGAIDRLFNRSRRRAKTTRHLDRTLWCVDTTIIRASRAAGGALRRSRAGEPDDHALGRSRGGFGTKLALVCDGRGLPLAAVVRPGQQHDVRSFPEVVQAAMRLARPRRLTGDKAYSVAWIRTWLRDRGVRPVIPTRSDQRPDLHFDRASYRRRNVVERLVGWLKEARRVATRYDKLALHYLAMVKLAMTRRILRLAEFPNRR
jgi:transposase